MHSLSHVLSGFLRRVFKLVFMAFTAALLSGLLLAGMSVALTLVLWSLLRGRRPALFSAFSFFRQASSQLRQGAWTKKRPQGTSEVVDVQAREVRAVLPGGTDPKDPIH